MSSCSSQRPAERFSESRARAGPKLICSIATRSGPPASSTARTAFSRSWWCSVSPLAMIRRASVSTSAQPLCFAGSMPSTSTRLVYHSCPLEATSEVARKAALSHLMRHLSRLSTQEPGAARRAPPPRPHAWEQPAVSVLAPRGRASSGGCQSPLPQTSRLVPVCRSHLGQAGLPGEFPRQADGGAACSSSHRHRTAPCFRLGPVHPKYHLGTQVASWYRFLRRLGWST